MNADWLKWPMYHDQVIAGPLASRMKVVAHEDTLPGSPVELGVLLNQIRIEALPKYTGSKGYQLTFERFAEVNIMRGLTQEGFVVGSSAVARDGGEVASAAPGLHGF